MAVRDTFQENVEHVKANSAEESIQVISDDEYKFGTRTTVEDGSSPATDIAADVSSNVVTGDEDMTNVVVAIALEKFEINDAITDKLDAKMIKFKRIEIHRMMLMDLS